MTENKMEQVAKLFGKKLNEVFTVTYADMVVNANFTSQGLCVENMSWEYGARVLSMMLLGEAEIVEEKNKMNDLRKMLDEFRNNYVYIQVGMCTAGVRKDNELIYRILSEMMDRIEAIERQNNRTEIVKNENE